jgi:hypothetical protein
MDDGSAAPLRNRAVGTRGRSRYFIILPGIQYMQLSSVQVSSSFMTSLATFRCVKFEIVSNSDREFAQWRFRPSKLLCRS